MPHLLQLVGVVRVWYPLLKFPLPPLQIAFGELVHGLVQERRRPHRRLADRQVEDALRGHVVGNQLLEGVLDDAAGQRLRGVVAGRLLAVPSGEPVNEASLRVDAELLPPLVVQVVHPLVLGVLVEVAGRDEPGVLQVVRVVLRLLDLVKVLLREEPAIREQRLINRAELVDPKLRVGDASPTTPAPARGSAQRHQPDDRLQHPVPQLDFVEQRRGAFPEQGTVELADVEGVLPVAELPGPALETVPDQSEERLDGVVEVEAVQRLLAVERNNFEVAQVLQAVAHAVGVCVHRRVAEVGAGLDVEQEQQPVHVPEAFEPEFPRQLVVEVVHLVPAHLAEVADRLVPDGFDGFPKRVLQVLGNREGVLVAVLVEPVEEALAVGRQERVPVEQRRRRLQGGVLAPAEDLVEVEAEQPVVRPLPPLDQQDPVEGEQEHPARRVVPPEDAARDHVVPGGVEQFLRRRRLPVELRRVRMQG